MDNRVVIFTENNARVLINPKNIDQYRNSPNALINPDFSRVSRIPPHLWGKSGDQLIELSQSEIEDRIKHIEYFGVENDIHKPVIKRVIPVIVPKVVLKELVIVPESKPVIVKIPLFTRIWRFLVSLFT